MTAVQPAPAPGRLPLLDDSKVNLDYLARPENYTGSNMAAMQRIILVRQSTRTPSSGSLCNSDDLNVTLVKTSMSRLYERYKHYGGDTEENDLLSAGEGRGGRRNCTLQDNHHIQLPRPLSTQRDARTQSFGGEYSEGASPYRRSAQTRFAGSGYQTARCDSSLSNPLTTRSFQTVGDVL